MKLFFDWWERNFQTEEWFKKLPPAEQAARIKLAEKRKVQAELEDRREDWAKDNLKVGDIVKMQGASQGGLREVIHVKEDSATCRIVRPATNKTQLSQIGNGEVIDRAGIIFVRQPYITEHMLNKVLKVLNKETGKMENVV